MPPPGRKKRYATAPAGMQAVGTNAGSNLYEQFEKTLNGRDLDYLDNQTGKPQHLSVRSDLTLGSLVNAALIKGALEGKLPYIRELYDRLEGRAVQQIQVKKETSRSVEVLIRMPSQDGAKPLSFDPGQIGSASSPIDITPEIPQEIPQEILDLPAPPQDKHQDNEAALYRGKKELETEKRRAKEAELSEKREAAIAKRDAEVLAGKAEIERRNAEKAAREAERLKKPPPPVYKNRHSYENAKLLVRSLDAKVREREKREKEARIAAKVRSEAAKAARKAALNNPNSHD